MGNEGTRRGDVRMRWRAGSLAGTRTLWLQLTQRAGTYDRRPRRGVPLDRYFERSGAIGHVGGLHEIAVGRTSEHESAVMSVSDC
jgi:hypothetical protein